jgi:hypothetical protein
MVCLFLAVAIIFGPSTSKDINADNPL